MVKIYLSSNKIHLPKDKNIVQQYLRLWLSIQIKSEKVVLLWISLHLRNKVICQLRFIWRHTHFNDHFFISASGILKLFFRVCYFQIYFPRDRSSSKTTCVIIIMCAPAAEQIQTEKSHSSVCDEYMYDAVTRLSAEDNADDNTIFYSNTQIDKYHGVWWDDGARSAIFVWWWDGWSAKRDLGTCMVFMAVVLQVLFPRHRHIFHRRSSAVKTAVLQSPS